MPVSPLPRWKLDGRYWKFITMGPQYRSTHPPNPHINLLIEKDARGISYEVQLACVEINKWLIAQPTLETVYML